MSFVHPNGFEVFDAEDLVEYDVLIDEQHMIKDFETWAPLQSVEEIPSEEWNFATSEDPEMEFSRRYAIDVWNPVENGYEKTRERQVLRYSASRNAMIQLWPARTPNASMLVCDMWKLDIDDFILMWNVLQRFESPFCVALEWEPVTEKFWREHVSFPRLMWEYHDYRVYAATLTFRNDVFEVERIEMYFLETLVDRQVQYVMFTGSLPGVFFCKDTTDRFVKKCHRMYRNLLSPVHHSISAYCEEPFDKLANVPDIFHLGRYLTPPASDADSACEVGEYDLAVLPEESEEQPRKVCMWFCKGYKAFWEAFDSGMECPTVCDRCGGDYPVLDAAAHVQRREAVTQSPPAKKLRSKGYSMAMQDKGREFESVEKLRDRMEMYGGIRTSHKRRANRCDGPRFVPPAPPKRKLNRQKMRDQKYSMASLLDSRLGIDQSVKDVVYKLADAMQTMSLEHDIADVSKMFLNEFLGDIGEMMREALLFVSMLLLVVLVYKYGWSRTAIAMLAGMIMTKLVFNLEIRKFVWSSVAKITGDSGYLMASEGLEIPSFVPEILFGSLTAGFVGMLPTSKSFDSLCLRLDRIPKALKGLELLSHWIQEVFEHFKEFVRTKILGEAPMIKIDGGREDINAWIEEIKSMTHPSTVKNIQTDITLVGKAIDIYRKGLDFVKQIPNLPREMVEVVKSSQYAARKIYDAALQSAAMTGAMRAKPVCAMFIGDTSIGKTGTVYPLAFDACRALGLITPEMIKKNPKCWEPHMYARCSEMEFFDGYNGQQIVWFDDAFQRKDDLANPNTEIFELIRMVNIFQYYLHMASLNEKSNTVFQGRAIFLTTNDYDMFFPSIQSKEAIISRISHPMIVTLKDEFKDPTGRLDVQKVKEAMKVPGLHLQINEYQLCTLSNDQRPKPYGKKMDYFEMSAMIQEAIVNSVNDGHNMDKFMIDYAQLTPEEYKAKYLKDYTMAIGGEYMEKARDWVKQTTIDFLDKMTLETNFERRVLNRYHQDDDKFEVEEIEELYVDAVQCSEEEFIDIRMRQIEREKEKLDPFYYDNTSVLIKSREMLSSWIVKGQNRLAAVQQQWEQIKLANYDPELYVAKHPLMSKVMLLITLTVFVLGVFGAWKLTKWAFGKAVQVSKCVYGLTKNGFRSLYEYLGHEAFQLKLKRNAILERTLGQCCDVYESPDGERAYLPEWIKFEPTGEYKDYKLIHKAYAMAYGSSVGKHQKKPNLRMATGSSVGKQSKTRHLRMACDLDEEEFLEVYYTLPEDQRKRMVAFVNEGKDWNGTPAGEVFSDLKVLDDNTLEATSKGGLKIICHLKADVKNHAMAVNDQTGTHAQYKANHNHWHFKFYWTNARGQVMESEAGMAVAIHGRIMMIPYHFVKAIEIKGDRLVEIRVFDEYHPDGIPIDLESFFAGHQLISKSLSAEKQKDVYLFDAGRTFPTSKSLLRLWCTAEDMPRAHGMMGSFLTREIVPNSTKVVNYMQRERVELIPNFDKKVTMESEGQTIELQYAAMFQVPIGCQRGDCGAILTINDKRMQRKFCGILTLIADFEEETLFTVINREEIDETLKKFSDESQIVLPEKFSMSLVNESDPSRVRLAKGNFHPIGTARPAPSGSKTALTESLIHGKVVETTRMPAKLKPDGEHDPLWTGLEKCGQPVVLIDTKMIEMARKDVANVMNGATRKYFDINKYKRVLTFEEAVQGWDGDDFVNSISRTTSPGYPWVFDKKPGTTGKQTWFGKEDVYDLSREECLLLKRKCLEMLVAATRNERSDVIFIDTLKDELRAIEKVLQGKTRVFSAGPMHYTIVARQYFLGYCAWAQHHRIENQLAVGIRPFDMDWHTLALKLQTKGTGVVAGDFTNYDGTESAQILWAICDNINEWYDDGPQNARIRRVLFAEIAHGIHIAEGNVYQWDRSLPSGNPFTAIFNSIYNLIAMRVVWLLMTGRSLMDFNKHVWMIAYGDDNVINLSKFAQDIFNQTIMSEGFKRIGMVYTDETKTGTGQVRDLKEITFLKRAFRFAEDHGKYVAPLQFQTVLDQTNWIRNNENAVSATAMNVGVCVRELSLHGREIFDEWYPKVRGVLTPQILKEVKLGASYDDYLTMWKSGELEDEQWF